MAKSEIILREGELIDYQTMIEEVVGMFLSREMNYDANFDEKTHINGKKIDKDRAYFVGDADYEIKIIKKRNKNI